MALRKREKRTEQSKIDATPPWEVRHRDEPEPTTGPFDVRDAPADEVARIDLGALRVPADSGLELRLDVNESQQVISVTLSGPSGQMQLGIFAAPRNEGIWDDVRSEIKESLVSQRGSGTEREDGPFGTELVGKLPAESGGGLVPVRFIGVDGPRWFLRAMLLGAVAGSGTDAEIFEQVLRQVVVVRGSEPLPVREPVALQLPREALDQLAAENDEPA